MKNAIRHHCRYAPSVARFFQRVRIEVKTEKPYTVQKNAFQPHGPPVLCAEKEFLRGWLCLALIKDFSAISAQQSRNASAATCLQTVASLKMAVIFALDVQRPL